MKTWLLLTIGIAGIGCVTPAAVGPAASGPAPAPGWVAARAPSAAAVETDASDQPSVIVEATSPTEIRYRTEGETVVPLRHGHAPGPTIRRVRTHQGMWIGAGLGILAGLAATANRPPNDEAHGCDVYCGSGTGLAAVGLGTIGLGLGAAVGAIVGSLEMP